MSDKPKQVKDLVPDDDVAIIKFSPSGQRILRLDIVGRLTSTQVITKSGERYNKLTGKRIGSSGSIYIEHITATEKARHEAIQQHVADQRAKREAVDAAMRSDPRHILLLKISDLTNQMTQDGRYLRCNEATLSSIYDILSSMPGGGS